MKTFPKPLTPDEEKLFLQKYKEGDPDAKGILIERNLRLVAHVAKKYQRPEEDPEDLISIGTIGLIKAVTTFDHTKNNRLATYAARCIENELLMMLRMRKKSSKEVSLYEPIGMDKEGNEISLLDIIESNNVDVLDTIELEENTKKLYQLFSVVLNEREQKVLMLRYGLFGKVETTQREIARMLNISRSYVSRLEKNSLEKLKLEFDKRN